MSDLNTINKLEAVIFSEGGEVLSKQVLKALSITSEQLAELVQEYNNSSRGMVLIYDNKKVLMRVASEYTYLIDQLRKDVLNESLSNAALEALAIVLYRDSNGTSASEVEQLRGVNSGYTLRQLTMRGLLNKSKQGMSYIYTPTAELLAHIGIADISQLPELTEVQDKLKIFADTQEVV